MTVPRPRPHEHITALRCRAGCRVDPALRHHHDRLLSVELEVAVVLELMELAVTWDELDYSGVAVVPPGQWLEFAACHDWHDPERATRIFGVATDIALRPSRRATVFPPLGEVATAS